VRHSKASLALARKLFDPGTPRFDVRSAAVYPKARKQDKDDNQKLYGREVSAKELLIDGTVSTP
jgi:hypothetical protein